MNYVVINLQIERCYIAVVNFVNYIVTKPEFVIMWQTINTLIYQNVN